MIVMLILLFVCLFFIVLLGISNTHAIERANGLQHELDEIATRLYGSPENYERSKENVRECRTDREQKVAFEAAQKGITRADKQYPSRYRGMR